MKKFLSLFSLLITAHAFSQNINTQNIQIIRDTFGVPHIFGKTDEEAAYGFAYATCEDNFEVLQDHLLITRGRYGEVKGIEGAAMDFGIALVGARELVDKNYDALSPKVKSIVSAYVAGCNKYAELHPNEVLLKGVFPLTAKDILVFGVITWSVFTNTAADIVKMATGKLKSETLSAPKGSNGFLLNSNKTDDGSVILGINPHVALEGLLSFYEAQIHSDEGWNILGATFPGSPFIALGANENMGWTHTVAYADFDDVYHLRMHPSKKNTYYFDGQWLKLEEKVCHLKVKLGKIKIAATKKYYVSVYGPTLKSKGQFYSIRFPAAMSINSVEELYRMNKATNLEDFKAAMKMNAYPGFNTLYADKSDNIYYIVNGQFPKRNPNYNWKNILPGDTSATLWKANDYYPFDSMFQIQNPKSGYLFSNNSSPFYCTSKQCNLDAHTHPLKNHMADYINNRSIRTGYLLENSGKLSYEQFKAIKYDQQLQTPAYKVQWENIEDLFHLDAKKYPEIAEAIEVLSKWDRKANAESKGASLFALTIQFASKQATKDGIGSGDKHSVSETDAVSFVLKAQQHLKKYFGSVEVPLGDLQKLVRGNIELPASGIKDVNATAESKAYKDGKYKVTAGETYVSLVQYRKDGTMSMETSVPFGSSNKKESKHYTDQMQNYVSHKLKPMTLNYEELMKHSERVYHPE